MIVVDANVLAYYLIDGVRTADANALRELDAEWMVPSFWSVEFQSILWKYVRFGGMPMNTAHEYLEEAVDMFSPNEVTPAPDIVLRDAVKWGITIYDAQYASLARQFGVPCVKEDVPVQEACANVAVSMTGFIRSFQFPDGNAVREKRPVYRTRRRSVTSQKKCR